MVIEIAKDDLIPPQRRPEKTAEPPLEPAIRRLRWGSLKSRSYDHAGDRRTQQQGRTPSGPRMETYSLDRRDHSLPPRQYQSMDSYDQPIYKGNGVREPGYSRGYGYPTSSREYPPRDAYPAPDYGKYDQREPYRGRYEPEYRKKELTRPAGEWDAGAEHREAIDFREAPYRQAEREARDYSREREMGRYEPLYDGEKLGNGGPYGLSGRAALAGGVPTRRDYGKPEEEASDLGWSGVEPAQPTSSSQQYMGEQSIAPDER